MSTRTAIDSLQTEPSWTGWEANEPLGRRPGAGQAALLAEDLTTIQRRVADADALGQIVGAHPAMIALRVALLEAARGDAPVVIRGEAGSGRTLCARVLHALGGQPESPFVAVPGDALSPRRIQMVLSSWAREESARTPRRGLAALASGGTLVLEEVDTLSLVAQGRLLDLLVQYKTRRLGETPPGVKPLRIVATTRHDLNECVRRQAFRGDLLAFLRGEALCLPPLRERGSDVRLLTRHFARTLRRNWRAAVWEIAPSALRVFERHTWPGNVSELREVIAEALWRAGAGQILPCHVEIPGPRRDAMPDTSDWSAGYPAAGDSAGSGDSHAVFAARGN